MGTGICLFLGEKMGFHALGPISYPEPSLTMALGTRLALGLGFISKKTIENGNGIKI
jgi:hypothetical protein